MICIESEERPWGRFFVIHDESHYKIKRIEIEPGERLSYQYHNKRSEAWTIVEGTGIITLNGQEKEYSKGETVLFQLNLQDPNALRQLSSRFQIKDDCCLPYIQLYY